MKKFLKSNVLVWIYFALAMLIELVAVFVTSDKFYIRSPYIFLLIQFLIMLVLLTIISNKIRHIIASCLLIFFMILDLVFIVIFEMTETIFDYGMFNLRNDGMAILESVPINFTFFAISMLAITTFIIFGGRYVKYAEKPMVIKWYAIPSILVVIAGLSTTLYLNNRNFEEDVQAKLYRSSEASYCEYGVVGNFLNEFVKGTFFSEVDLGDEQQLEDFIYDEVYATNFANSENYNVVTILVESLEWHGFMQDFDLFANGHNINYSQYQDENGNTFTSAEDVLRVLYPNLYKFYDSSIVLSNFYSREKTDISENISFLGSYPTNVYINYDFPYNTMSSTLPSVLKTLDEDITCNSFHNGSYTYYNRNKELISAGFDSYTATDQMKKMDGFTDYSAKGERNLDSEMIKVCADKMFPEDQRFYSYITTITMHGQYTYRNNLKKYYDKLSDYGITTKGGDSYEAFNHNNFYYYSACVMEFDTALGVVLDELASRHVNGDPENETLLDNTIICLFGDHNTYYSSLSNYVKDIDKPSNSKNYTNLFRVPCMIKYPDMDKLTTYLNTTLIDELATEMMSQDSDLDLITAKDLASEQINNRYQVSVNKNGTQILVKKFMCTADIVPTLFDLCGINVYGNMYFGHSVFEWQESVLYSRAYDMFITDNMYFVSLNNIKYMRKDNPLLNNDPALKYADIKGYDSEEHLIEVEVEAKKLLEKLSVCNRIFYNDYFARRNINDNSKTNAQIFVEKIKSINGG